jgi:hypothetical protein
MKLIPLIKKINGIKRDVSENQTLISTILPLFRYLGWDIFDENRVIFEDVTSTKKRVDVTFVFSRGDRFIIEAKRLTHKLSIKDFEQLTLYINSDEDVNYGILTNGIDYWIADNHKDGLENKNIYRFNIFELTECDLDILKIFFSYGARHNLRNINRYIEYVETGLEFGDKKCSKILQLSDDDIDDDSVEPTPPPPPLTEKEELIESSKNSKADFSDVSKFSPPPSIEEKKPVEEVVEPSPNPKSGKKQQDNRTAFENDTEDIIDLTGGSSEPDEVEESSLSADSIIDYNGGEIEHFNLIEKSKAKIYLNGKYHILSDSSFSTVFLKVLRYLFQNLESMPVLFAKVSQQFDFIVSSENRTQQSAKYEPIFDNYYYNTNITNYIKIVNLEALLKYIDKNIE